jgi:hypothetical protein
VIDLLFQVFYVLAVLAVISLFVCTIPVWLVVLVAVFLLRWSLPPRREQVTLVIKKGAEGWLIYKVRKSTRTRIPIVPLKSLEEARAIAVFGILACEEVTRIRFEG